MASAVIDALHAHAANFSVNHQGRMLDSRNVSASLSKPYPAPANNPAIPLRRCAEVYTPTRYNVMSGVTKTLVMLMKKSTIVFELRINGT